MTYEEYKKELSRLDREREAKAKELARRYALANNPYKVGDIVTDHCDTVKIEKVQIYYTSMSKPCCVYSGPLLKKDGTPRKDGKNGSVYQSNIQTSKQ